MKSEQAARKHEQYEKLKATLPRCCQQYLESESTLTLAPHTRVQYAYRLKSYCDYIQAKENGNDDLDTRILKASETDIDQYISSTFHIDNETGALNVSASTLRQALSCLTSLYKYFKQEGYIDEIPHNRKEYKTKYKTSAPKNRKKDITNNEVRAIENMIIQATNLSKSQKIYNKKNKFRDILIIRILQETHASAQMISDIDIDDINEANNTIRLTYPNGSTADITVPQNLIASIITYTKSFVLGGRESFKPNEGEKALFISRKHGRIAPRTIQYMIKEFADLTFEDSSITPLTIASYSNSKSSADIKPGSDSLQDQQDRYH